MRIYTWEPQHPRNTFSSSYGADYHNVTFDGGTDTATLLVDATDDGKGVAPAWLQAEVDPPGTRRMTVAVPTPPRLPSPMPTTTCT